MSVKRTISEPDAVYFITFTCHQWKPLIAQTNSYDKVYKWFDYLKENGHYIAGYVIMPNHIHAVIAFRNTGKSINTIVGNGKRFIAYEVVKRLKEIEDTKTLQQLSLAVKAKDKERNKKHEVWENSFDWKDCRDNKFIKQKIDYMHLNPCRGKWNLATEPVMYEHSSARFYITGKHAAYEVINFCELSDIDLTTSITESTAYTQGKE